MWGKIEGFACAGSFQGPLARCFGLPALAATLPQVGDAGPVVRTDLLLHVLALPGFQSNPSVKCLTSRSDFKFIKMQRLVEQNNFLLQLTNRTNAI